MAPTLWPISARAAHALGGRPTCLQRGSQRLPELRQAAKAECLHSANDCRVGSARAARQLAELANATMRF